MNVCLFRLQHSLPHHNCADVVGAARRAAFFQEKQLTPLVACHKFPHIPNLVDVFLERAETVFRAIGSWNYSERVRDLMAL